MELDRSKFVTPEVAAERAVRSGDWVDYGFGGGYPELMDRALADLERQGLLYTNRTSGRYVTEDEEMITKIRERIAEERICAFLESMSQLGFTQEQVLGLIQREREEKNA